MQALSRAGAELDLQDKMDQTALVLACRSATGGVEIVNVLIAAGVQLDIQSKFDTTALMQASFRGDTKIVSCVSIMFAKDRGLLQDNSIDRYINSGCIGMKWSYTMSCRLQSQ